MPAATALVVVKAVPVTISAVGVVEALSRVEVRAQVSGQVSGVHFSEGDEVGEGQPLFSLDPRPFQASLEEAQAVLARDIAQSNNATAQSARYEDLFRRGLIPRDQYEAQAASSAAMQATLAADRARVAQAELSLEYATIVSPLTGKTGTMSAHVGDLIRASDANPLVTITALAPIAVTFSVPSRFLPAIRTNQARGPLLVTAAGAGQPGTQAALPGVEGGDSGPAAPSSAQGRVSFLDNAVDPATAMIKLKATFPNQDHSLWPGLFVEVSLRLSTDTHAVVVPATAVQTSQQGPYVYVVRPDRTVDMRRVAIDRQQGDEVVVASGLSGGEEVVTDGQLRLAPGASITTGESSGPDRGAP